jgi:hypothetical protein
VTLRLLLASGIGVYGSFFATQPKPTPASPAIQWNAPAPTAPAQLTVVCGMTLVPGDPKLDRSMKKAAPDAKRFPMKTVEPQVCKR